MNRYLKYVLIFALILVSGYFLLGYLSSYIGWYGYKKWEYRVGSSNIEEAKKRGVFVKELNFSVEGYAGDLYGFAPFISRDIDMENIVPQKL